MRQLHSRYVCEKEIKAFVLAQIGRMQFGFIVPQSHSSKLKEKRRSCLTSHSTLNAIADKCTHTHTHSRLHIFLYSRVNMCNCTMKSVDESSLTNHIIESYFHFWYNILLVVYLSTAFCFFNSTSVYACLYVRYSHTNRSFLLQTSLAHTIFCTAQCVCVCVCDRHISYQKLNMVEAIMGVYEWQHHSIDDIIALDILHWLLLINWIDFIIVWTYFKTAILVPKL